MWFLMMHGEVGRLVLWGMAKPYYSHQVKVGVDAPRGCKIWRKELYKTVEANRIAAEASSPVSLKSLAKKLPANTQEGS